MKTSRKKLKAQRQIIENKASFWKHLTHDRKPPSGWVRAVRKALGLSARQLAALMDVDPSAVVRLESREVKGTVSLELLERAARAMKCKLIYAVVPDEEHSTFESILDERAMELAKRVVNEVSHTMKLEAQGVVAQQTQDQIKSLARELKENLDPRLWPRASKGG